MRDMTSRFDLLSDTELTQMESNLHEAIDRRKVSRRRRHRVVAAGIALLVVGGGTTAGALLAWPTNEHGQTYGPADGRVEDPANGTVVEPDLTLAVGDDGVVGYILSTDLSPVFASPDEVAEWLEEHPPTVDREIPLYDKDGNVIGTFTIQGVDPAELGVAE
jgi:hypothetical protein